MANNGKHKALHFCGGIIFTSRKGGELAKMPFLQARVREFHMPKKSEISAKNVLLQRKNPRTAVTREQKVQYTVLSDREKLVIHPPFLWATSLGGTITAQPRSS